MLCQICNKNPATIHIQEVVNGKKQSLHLCLTCAGKRSFDQAALDGMDLAELMSSLEQSISEMGLIPFKELGKESSGEQKLPDLHCAVCDWSLVQFDKTGHLGCPACYDAFADVLENKMLDLHRAAIHTGKLPGVDYTQAGIPTPDRIVPRTVRKRDLDSQIAELERDLKQSVLREEYELAAQIRDRINALRNKNEKES